MNPKDDDAPPVLSIEYLFQEMPLPTPSVLQQAVRYEALTKLSTGKECLHLRGIPVDAQPETIIQFLGPDAHSVVPQGVHIIYPTEGQPSGQAIIQMDSEESAFWAVANSHDRCMIGPRRKPSRIEALLCSVHEMRAMLAGSSPSGEAREPQQEPGNPGPAPMLTRQPATMATPTERMPPTFVPRDTPSSAPRPTVPPETWRSYKVTWFLVHNLSEIATVDDIKALINGSLGLKTGGIYMVQHADISVSAAVGVQCRPETVQAVLNCRPCHYIGDSKIDLRIVDADYESHWLKTPRKAHLGGLPAL